MWPSCCATAGAAARTTASSMNQNLNRPVGLGRAVGEKEDRNEERAFGPYARGGGHGLPERQAINWRGDGERIGIEAECELGTTGDRRAPRTRGIVKPNLQACRVT